MINLEVFVVNDVFILLLTAGDILQGKYGIILTKRAF